MSQPARILELRSVRGTGGGPEKTILQGTARTDRERFKITVCYIRDRRDQVFGVSAQVDGLPIDYVELYERNSFDPALWPALRRIVVERGIRIVHAHEYKTNLLAWLLGRSTGIIPLSTSHGWTGHSARERFVYYPADKRLLRRFPRVIAVSSDIRNELIRCGGNPDLITTVLNGIDHEVFRRVPSRVAEARESLGIAPTDIVIGAVGRLEPQKRFDLLLDAVVRVRARCPSVRLIIAGDGSMRGTLEEKRRALNVGSYVTFIGHSQDVARLHHAFDVFVQSSDYEGTPNAVLEAMALETPVVATNVGGTSELLTDRVHGRVVPAGNVVALSDAIEDLLANSSRRRAFAMAARERIVQELSFASRMHRIETIYDELLTRSVPSPQLAGSCA